MELFLNILKGLFKIIWKAFLVVLWAISKTGEFIFKEINKILTDAIK